MSVTLALLIAYFVSSETQSPASSCQAALNPTNEAQPELPSTEPSSFEPVSSESQPPLRTLSSLRWPYVPEQSSYPDPLSRNDPKPLQVHQYEAIATAPEIRSLFASHPQLAGLLRNIDSLRGEDREEALERALGVHVPAIGTQPSIGSKLDDDTIALRALAEAVELAVRGDKSDALGLDWGD